MTVTICGKEFKMVNEVSDNIMEQFTKAVISFEQYDVKTQKELLKNLGGGACGSVWELAHDYIIKVNDRSFGDCAKDGEIMEALQGLPLVPKIYAYSEGNEYMLIQRIHGKTILEVQRDDIEFDFTDFDNGSWTQKVTEFIGKSTERGWTPYDLHSENCMVDQEGNFWVVDFGLFKDANRWSQIDSYTDSQLHSHLRYISKKVKSKHVSQLPKFDLDDVLRKAGFGV